MSKTLVETVRLQSEKRREWIRKIRERLKGIAEGASSAPHLASSSAALFPRRNECLGTHCSLIVQKGEKAVPARSATEFEIIGKMEERTERESDRRREEKWQTCWCCRDQQRACRMAQASAKNLNKLGLLKRKEWPQCHRESSWQVRRSHRCQKEKEHSCLSSVPDHQGGESQGGQEGGGSEREHGEVRVDSMVNEGRFQEGNGGQAKRASLREVQGSMSG